MIVDDHGTRRFVCSDSDYCSDRRGGAQARADGGDEGNGGGDGEMPAPLAAEQPLGETT